MEPTVFSNVELIEFPALGDERGSLVAVESLITVPFDIKRVYYLFGTKHNVTRGLHAHKKLSQVLICISGSCTVKVETKMQTKMYKLNCATKGLLIQGLVWREMYSFSSDCVLLVLADQLYSEEDYIREYKEFRAMVNYEQYT